MDDYKPKTQSLLNNTSSIRLFLAIRKLSLVLVAIVLGCDDGTSPPLSSLSFSSTSITLSSLGETYQLKISAKTTGNGDFQNPSVEWSSVNTEIAEVSKTGLVTAVTNGTTEIVARKGALTANISVVVHQKPTNLVVSINKVRFENIGDTAQLYAAASDALGNVLLDPNLNWISSNTSIAAVSPSGLVTAINLGTTDIAVEAENVSAMTNITVSHWDRITPGYKMTCGIRTSHEVYCWGNNEHGQIGDGTTTEHDRPKAIAEDQLWASIVSMVYHSCGILTSQQSFCWGRNNYGQLGIGSSEEHYRPTEIAEDLPLETIEGGFQHSCSITSLGTIKCWGRNNYGQLGTGNGADQLLPTDISTQLNWVDIAAGSYHTCAIANSDRIYCWGLNQFGQLGNGTTVDRNNPHELTEQDFWTKISAGLYHTCAINQAGEAYCWGLNDQKQLGSERNQSQWPYPDKVKTLNLWTDISAGRSHTCGLNDTRQAFCWGDNEYGQLGDSSQNDRPSPVPVNGNHTWKDIEAGVYHTCGVTISGVGYCWGNNEYSQLGDHTDLVRTIPRKIGITKY